MGARITTRPVAESDRAFLLLLYAGTREDLALTDWPEDQKRSFVEMQFEAQARDYTARFPAATHAIIQADGADVGRVWIDRRPDEIRLLDITILPECRDRGTGGTVLRRLIAEAVDTGAPLRHSVFRTNEAALRFYRRLGFEVVEDHEMYVLMEWAGPTPGG